MCLTITTKMMEEYKRKYSEVSERLMERNRQYQKLQGLYDSLRLRSMVGVGERDPPPPPKEQFNTGEQAGCFQVLQLLLYSMRLHGVIVTIGNP